jgi:hypothetical protein
MANIGGSLIDGQRTPRQGSGLLRQPTMSPAASGNIGPAAPASGNYPVSVAVPESLEALAQSIFQSNITPGEHAHDVDPPTVHSFVSIADLRAAYEDADQKGPVSS